MIRASWMKFMFCHNNKMIFVLNPSHSGHVCWFYIDHVIPHSFLSPAASCFCKHFSLERGSKMSSLPSSLASPTHTKHIKTSLTAQPSSAAFKIYANHDQKFNNKNFTSQQLQANGENTTNCLFRRREAIGLALSFSTLLDFLGQNVAVAAEATAPCEFTSTPSGLAFCDRVVGFGPEASKGQLIKAHYTGKLENGKVFDSSYNRGKPLTFRIGVGEVIKGWDQGILGGDGVPPMLAGGKRTLKLPPQLGYGMRGAGCKGGSCIIPPDSVLLFDVEFIGKA